MPSSGSATKTRPRELLTFGEPSSASSVASGWRPATTSAIAASLARSTSLTKSLVPLDSQASEARRSAPWRMISAPRAAAATHVASSARVSARPSARATPTRSPFLATRQTRSLRSRDGTYLQRHPAVRGAPHRQLPRCGEELGGAAAHGGIDLLHRGLPRDHHRLRAGAASRPPTRDGARAARRGNRPGSVARCSCSRTCRNIPSWRGSSTPSRRSVSSSDRRSSRTSRSGRRA